MECLILEKTPLWFAHAAFGRVINGFFQPSFACTTYRHPYFNHELLFSPEKNIHIYCKSCINHPSIFLNLLGKNFHFEKLVLKYMKKCIAWKFFLNISISQVVKTHKLENTTIFILICLIRLSTILYKIQFISQHYLPITLC